MEGTAKFPLINDWFPEYAFNFSKCFYIYYLLWFTRQSCEAAGDTILFHRTDGTPRLGLLRQLVQGRGSFARAPASGFWVSSLYPFHRTTPSLLKSCTLHYEKICSVLTWHWGRENLKNGLEDCLVWGLREKVISLSFFLSLSLV